MFYSHIKPNKEHTSFVPLNKGSPVCISTNIHPKLHMSIAKSYGIPSKTSGER